MYTIKNLRKDPTTLVLFGITGDLSHRKIIPALYHLHEDGHLPDLFNIVGFARRSLTTADVKT